MHDKVVLFGYFDTKALCSQIESKGYKVVSSDHLVPQSFHDVETISRYVVPFIHTINDIDVEGTDKDERLCCRCFLFVGGRNDEFTRVEWNKFKTIFADNAQSSLVVVPMGKDASWVNINRQHLRKLYGRYTNIATCNEIIQILEASKTKYPLRPTVLSSDPNDIYSRYVSREYHRKSTNKNMLHQVGGSIAAAVLMIVWWCKS